MLMSLQQHIAEFASVLLGSSLEDKAVFVEKIKPSSKIPPQLAIDIYRNNTCGSRVNALNAVYPACKNILGDDIFNSIAKEYVATNIIGSSDLNNYGTAFDQHLALMFDAERIPADYNYLPDLARLEFLFHIAYYADDDPIFDFELFERRVQKGQQIYLRTSESLALISFQTPIHQIWISNCKGARYKTENVQALTETQYLLIYREENIPVVTTINHCEHHLLDEIINNQSLQRIVDSIECDIEVILPRLISKKWITGIM